ncbi:MAG: biotin--[acetyl-CoA-carboxylase] ligase [Verrucomicrobiota bacterium]|nr:biotin--[acetyl-CoA-carboxylase] ligase [Verrucomicrobiota bacterium]
MNPDIPPAACERRIGQGPWNGDLLLFECLPSTNRWALEHVRDLAHGDAIRAVRQTAGRGRFQRRWFAPEDRALALSVALHPDRLRADTIAAIGQAAAVAIQETLAEYRLPALLKWPNDVMLAGRKIAGALAEQDSASGRTVLGMGLNVNVTAADLSFILPRESATSMLVASGQTYDVAEAGAVVLRELSRFIARMESEGACALPAHWARYDFLQGRLISVQETGGSVTGRYAGLDSLGRLRLVTTAGDERLFWSADVSLQETTGPAARNDPA